VFQKNAPTLASCSFVKHGLILIIFGKLHQHTFGNDMHVQLSLFLHFNLFFATRMQRSHVPLCSWNSPAPLARNTGLYLSRSVSAKQFSWLQNFWTDAGTCVNCTNTCPRHQPLWPATWSSASLTHGQRYYKTSSMKQLVNEERDYVQVWGKRTSLWTSAKTGTFHSQHTTQPALSEPPTIYRRKHVVSRHFHRSYLKAYKVRKVKVQGKLNKHYYF